VPSRRREGDNGEAVVEGEGGIDGERDWSEETVEAEHSSMISVTPATPPTPAEDTPPTKVLPDNRQQSRILSDRFNGEGMVPSLFLDGGDAAV